MKQLTFLVMGIFLALTSAAQAPQGFNYQAIIRNTEGEPLSEQNVSVLISIQNEDGTITHYTESHAITTSPQGVINLKVGYGDPSIGSFDEILWEEGSLFLKLEVDPAGGTSYSHIGTSQLLAVPYAQYAGKASELIVPQNANEDEPLFVVHNNAGQVVFAVYQTGVRIYVEDDGVKSTRGGFAIGGLSDQTKVDGVEYLRITPDSVRFNINTPDDGVKATRGGFAVGGLSDQTKGASTDLLFIAPDSARIYVKNSTAKQTRGGFAVGGLSDQTKETPSNFLFLTPENYFIGHNSGYAITTGLYNSALGYESGMNINSGESNSFVGYQSGYLNNTGTGNLFLGYQTGYSNQHGNYNTFLGYRAGYMNYQGKNNTFLGSFSGQSNIDGSFNTFIGDSTGFANTYGYSNTFIGTSSGIKNTTGYSNVMVGTKAGYNNNNGGYNVFIGHMAGLENTDAGSNVYIGTEAGKSSEDGWNNIYVGTRAGINNIDGEGNLMIGYEAGLNNENGTRNVFIGNWAGRSEMGSEKLYIDTRDEDSTYAFIWGDFLDRKLRFNATVGVGTHPIPGVNFSVNNSFGAGSMVIKGVGDSYDYSRLSFMADTSINKSYYSYVYSKNNGFFLGYFDEEEEYHPRITLDSAGKIGLNATPTSVSLYLNDPVDAATMVMRGEGNDYDYSMLKFESEKYQANRNYALSFSTNSSFILGYNDGVLIHPRLKVDSTGYITINNWADGTEMLDVNGNARFRSIGSGDYSASLSITEDGTLTTASSDISLKTNIVAFTNGLSAVLALRGVKYNWLSKPLGPPKLGFIAQEVEKVLPEVVFTNPTDGLKGINYAEITAVLVEAIKEQQEQIQKLEEKLKDYESLMAEIEAIKSIIGK